MSRMDYSVSLYKSTKNGVYHVPKPKHLTVILHTLKGFNPSFKAEAALQQMFELIRGKRACCIVKTVYCLHLCINEMSPGFSRRLVSEQADNDLINDTDSWGQFYNGLAVSYWRYLRALANLKGNYPETLSRPWDRMEQLLANIPISQLLKQTEGLIEYYEKAAFNKEPMKKVMTYKKTEISVRVFEKLLEDISGYHRIVLHTTDALLSRSDEMDLNTLKITYELSRRLHASQDFMKELIKLGHEFDIRNVPKLEVRDNSINRILEGMIRQKTVSITQTRIQTPQARKSIEEDLLIFEDVGPRQALREISNQQPSQEVQTESQEVKNSDVGMMMPNGYGLVPMMIPNMYPLYQNQWIPQMFSPRNPFM